MTGGTRGPLRFLGRALAATALLVVLQTFVLRAIPYDGSAFPVAIAFFRAAFMATDIAAIVALVVLNRRAPYVYAFTMLANVLLALTFASSAVAWFLSAVADKSESTALGGIEPMLTFGASILIAFAIASVLGPTAAPDARRNRAFYAALAFATIVLLMRIASSISRDAPSIALAWVRWAFAVAQPASLAVLAFVTARAKEAGEPAPDPLAAAAATAGGGYRAAGEGAVAVARPELAVPGPASVDPLRHAIAGIAMQRSGFIARIGMLVFIMFLAMGAGSEAGALLLPLFGLATAVTIAIGISRQRSLATLSVGSAMRAAFVSYIAATCFEGVAFVWVVGQIFARLHMEILALAFPAATFYGGLGILFASRAHARAGDLLFKFRLAGLARWTQAVLVLFASSTLATFAAAAHADRRSSSGSLGPTLAIGFALLTFAALLAVIIMHIMTLNEASRALKERLEKATSPQEGAS